MGEFIYTMRNVRKVVGEKVILDNVTMAFYPGAKIGVVGPNGAGKSSILKIMAGWISHQTVMLSLIREPPLAS